MLDAFWSVLEPTGFYGKNHKSSSNTITFTGVKVHVSIFRFVSTTSEVMVATCFSQISFNFLNYFKLCFCFNFYFLKFFLHILKFFVTHH